MGPLNGGARNPPVKPNARTKSSPTALKASMPRKAAARGSQAMSPSPKGKAG